MCISVGWNWLDFVIQWIYHSHDLLELWEVKSWEMCNRNNDRIVNRIWEHLNKQQWWWDRHWSHCLWLWCCHGVIGISQLQGPAVSSQLTNHCWCQCLDTGAGTKCLFTVQCLLTTHGSDSTVGFQVPEHIIVTMALGVKVLVKYSHNFQHFCFKL